MILAIETSTTFASVAVVDGDRTAALAESEARTHSEKLIALVDQALGEAGATLDSIEGIAVGVGPGSFTGLRIGMATVKGLCFAASKPMWVVSSLAALAFDAAPLAAGRVLVPVLDARRKEVFAGFYEWKDDALVSLSAEIVIGPQALGDATRAAVGDRDVLVFGDGARLYREIIEVSDEPGELPARPSAVAVGRLARGAAPASSIAAAAPVYIRKSEAEIRYPDGNPGGSYAPLDTSSAAATTTEPGKSIKSIKE